MVSPLERLWSDFLNENNIAFKPNYRVGLYEIDFLIGDNIDLEIDGLQHTKKDRLLKDRKRDAILQKMGITVIRVQMNSHNFHKKKQQEKFKKQKEEILASIEKLDNS